MRFFKKTSPGRLIVMGFAAIILLGAILLTLPVSHNSGVDVSFSEAIFTATSAACVTGLIVVDTADSFNMFGQAVIAILIQLGGLGFASVAMGTILLAGKRVTLKERGLVKEALNLGTNKGIIHAVKFVLLTTFIIEASGAILSIIAFSRDYPLPTALRYGIFHAVSSFNNAGFDILGGFENLTGYRSDWFLLLVTSALIILGGIGFMTISDVVSKRSFKKLSLNTKVVLTVTAVLLISGTILLLITERFSLLDAFFGSVTARTAGFSSVPFNTFSTAGLFVMMILMFIGASPGSTGGGIKTTTFFTLFRAIYSSSRNKKCSAFKRTVPQSVVTKAFVVIVLALSLVLLDTLLLCALQPELNFEEVMFEVISAFATVGLSTGITVELCSASRIIIIITMFIGRIGPLTVATLWSYKKAPAASYTEENLAIG
ncbi:MAG: H(+)-transporting ATPase [Clostridiales bacterium]|nr:H(+)-transporting ATPase [Clostridiales bacterium]